MKIRSDLSTASLEQSEVLPTSTGRLRITQASLNSVSDHRASQQTSNNNPTGGARPATTNSAPGYADIERMTEERLMSDPEYRELKEKYETWKNVETDFALIDANTGLITDGTVTIHNLRALANDGLANPEARAAAQRLLSNMSIWNALAKGDNIVGTHDVTAFISGMKDQLKGMKDTVRADIKAEQGIASAAAAASAAGGAAGGAGASSTSAPAGSTPLFKAPTLSTKPGMEGAVENVSNTLTAIANATADLAAKLADPNLKPEERSKIQAQYNELQQLQSMLTSMYKQLQEAIANLMKMYSDVAQNSIRNMK